MTPEDHGQATETNQHGEPCNCHDRLQEWCPVHRDEHPEWGKPWAGAHRPNGIDDDGEEGWG